MDPRSLEPAFRAYLLERKLDLAASVETGLLRGFASQERLPTPPPAPGSH